jgi:uncharacterized protein (TIGR03086 family)
MSSRREALRRTGKEPAEGEKMIDLKPACHALSTLVAGIADEQLDAGTPCAKYAVRDLIEHLDESARGFAAAAGGDVGEASSPLVAGSLADGWQELLGRRLTVLGEAWDSPAAWEGISDLAGLGLSNEEWGKIALTEVVVHGWDLSQATGLPFELPETTVQDCYQHVAGFLDQPPVPELWGAPVEVQAGSPLMDRLVSIAGRQP